MLWDLLLEQFIYTLVLIIRLDNDKVLEIGNVGTANNSGIIFAP